ncbi:MAG: translation elongation factor-like protein [Candidatus Eisenbacteria bacterium]|nr:translation elongation factor-like protein [Candidatus Eisenbacteria bacterium]
MTEEKVGFVEHYFDKLGVAAIRLTGPLKVGDKIHIKGHTTDVEQSIDSIQIEHASVPSADNGADIGVKVKDKVRQHDEVFRVVD